MPHRTPAKHFAPLAIGAPEPFRQLPVRLERMIHFVPPHIEKIRARVGELISQVDVVLGNPLPTSLDGGEWRIVAEGRLQPHRRALSQTPATTSVVAAANRNVRTSSRSSAATAAVRTGTTSCTRDARQRDSPPSAAYQSV